MITDFFNIEFTIYRMEYVDNKADLSSVGTFYGHKQRIVAELSENLGISFTKGHTIWAPVGTDIKEQDTIQDSDGKYYSIKAINKRDYGRNQHLEIIAEQDLDYVSI